MKTDFKISPVHFLYGPENYLMEEEIQRLMDQTLSEKEKGLNLHVFNGEEHSAREIVQSSQTIPMFSRYRFVLVKEADGMDEEKIEALITYIRKPSPTTCLVLQGQTLGLWKKYQKEIEKAGKAIEYPRLKGRALVSWVRKRMAEKGKGLSEEAADYLVEVVGDNLHQLENAIEESFLHVDQKGTVGLSDVEEIVSEVKVSTLFDLTDAIGHQDVEKALGILGKILGSRSVLFKREEAPSKMDDPIPLLLSMMARQYRLIWKVKRQAAMKQEPADLVKDLRMSSWNVKKLIDQGRRFTESSLREGILKCHWTDLAVKRGRGPKELLMEKLVIDLCRPNRPALH